MAIDMARGKPSSRPVMMPTYAPALTCPAELPDVAQVRPRHARRLTHPDFAIDDEFLDGGCSGAVDRDPDLDIVGTLDCEALAFRHEKLLDAVFDRDRVASFLGHAALDKQVGFG